MQQGRRDFLKNSGLAMLSVSNPLIPWAVETMLASSTVRAEAGASDTLVYIFLRGGADGLSILPPAESHPDFLAYQSARPTLALTSADVLPLDKVPFALNKACPNLQKHFTDKRASFFHGVGNMSHNSRSHFIQQDFIDRGGKDRLGRNFSNGFINRIVSSTPSVPQSPTLTAISISNSLSKAAQGGGTGNNLLIPVMNLTTGKPSDLLSSKDGFHGSLS